jgi:hypothetical protein
MEQIQKQNYEEKFKMYNKLSKKELVQMLIQANEVIARQTPQVYPYPLPMQPTTPINPYPWGDNVIYTNT